MFGVQEMQERECPRILPPRGIQAEKINRSERDVDECTDGKASAGYSGKPRQRPERR